MSILAALRELGARQPVLLLAGWVDASNLGLLEPPPPLPAAAREEAEALPGREGHRGRGVGFWGKRELRRRRARVSLESKP